MSARVCVEGAWFEMVMRWMGVRRGRRMEESGPPVPLWVRLLFGAVGSSPEDALMRYNAAILGRTHWWHRQI